MKYNVVNFAKNGQAYRSCDISSKHVTDKAKINDGAHQDDVTVLLFKISPSPSTPLYICIT